MHLSREGEYFILPFRFQRSKFDGSFNNRMNIQINSLSGCRQKHSLNRRLRRQRQISYFQRNKEKLGSKQWVVKDQSGRCENIF